MQIIIESKVKHKLFELILSLIKGDYFATGDSADDYVQKIYAFIDTLPNRTARKTKHNSSGEYFVTYKANRRTTWYIIFDISQERYLVRNVMNNHSKDYAEFITGLK